MSIHPPVPPLFDPSAPLSSEEATGAGSGVQRVTFGRPIAPPRPLVFALVLTTLFLVTPSARAFDLDDVAAKAQQMSTQPFKDPRGEVPQWMMDIDYDQWRDIRFRPDQALWRDRQSNFQVQFFHPGLYYDRAVHINVVTPAGVQSLPFETRRFDYGKNTFAARIPRELGYAGFRIHYPIKNPAYHDEVIVFLGASYFRALGRKEVYGISARGIAIDTLAPSGEEFPYFREFWLVQPEPAATEMTIYALLDGPSITGAYSFVLRPGERTTAAVESRLFLRKKVGKLGIAPLTSMFFHGENTNRCFDDFRPEVHDSDGLLLHARAGEWLWRPLDNPHGPHLSIFQLPDPRGFGVIQRDRNFASYQDFEANSELRPSAWVEPRGDWGAGAVELVELPTASDIHDNIVAYWTPAVQPKPHEPFGYAYTLVWYGDDPALPPGGRVVATRRDAGTGKDTVRFVIDFAGGALADLPADRPPRGEIAVAGGDTVAMVLDQHVLKNPHTGGWRLSFQVERLQPKKVVELRAFLATDRDALTETWSYPVLP